MNSGCCVGAEKLGQSNRSERRDCAHPRLGNGELTDFVEHEIAVNRHEAIVSAADRVVSRQELFADASADCIG